MALYVVKARPKNDISPESYSFLRSDISFFGLALTTYKAIIVLPIC